MQHIFSVYNITEHFWKKIVPNTLQNNFAAHFTEHFAEHFMEHLQNTFHGHILWNTFCRTLHRTFCDTFSRTFSDTFYNTLWNTLQNISQNISSSTSFAAWTFQGTSFVAQVLRYKFSQHILRYILRYKFWGTSFKIEYSYLYNTLSPNDTKCKSHHFYTFSVYQY